MLMPRLGDLINTQRSKSAAPHATQDFADELRLMLVARAIPFDTGDGISLTQF